MAGTKIGPFAQISFAEDHCTCRPQSSHQFSVLACGHVRERQRTGGRQHLVPGFDVVLNDHRDAVERAPVPAFAPRSQAARSYQDLWGEVGKRVLGLVRPMGPRDQDGRLRTPAPRVQVVTFRPVASRLTADYGR